MGRGGWGGGGSAYMKNLQHSPTYGRFCAYEEKGVATSSSAGYFLSEAFISSTEAKMFCLGWRVLKYPTPCKQISLKIGWWKSDPDLRSVRYRYGKLRRCWLTVGIGYSMGTTVLKWQEVKE